MSRFVAVISLWLAAAWPAQELPPAQGTPAAPQATAQEAPRAESDHTGAAPPPKIDMGRAIAEAVARMLATPRFEEQVEVRDTYQEALARYFAADRLSCGATESGPPPQDEMNRFRTHPIPPHADLLAGFKWLHRKLRGTTARSAPRFYLYWVRLKAAPERFVYVVHEGPIAENDRLAAPGTEWELLTAFPDAAKAADAVTRLSREVSSPSTVEPSRAVTLWAARHCPR